RRSESIWERSSPPSTCTTWRGAMTTGRRCTSADAALSIACTSTSPAFGREKGVEMKSAAKQSAIAAKTSFATAEHARLAEDTAGKRSWKVWGPYLGERQWGTVREDYSSYGGAWEYLSHDAARSRAYRWGEDGIAGFCDDQQRL